MNTAEDSLLGKVTQYSHRYSPELLFPIDRADKRTELGIDGGALPFYGIDVWNSYELSWLTPNGRPCVALAEFHFPATSPALVESKSFKLYLNGFSGERLEQADLEVRLARDLAAVTGAPVQISLTLPAAFPAQAFAPAAGTLIDDLDVAVDCYGPPRPAFLTTDDGATTAETLTSHLLKSNCPVTGQPDWGSVCIRYRGPRIERAGLLKYLVSFREHAEFHEHCVERIFMDISRRCRPQALSVYARYTRRGGLDINPFRSSVAGDAPDNRRTPRQ